MNHLLSARFRRNLLVSASSLVFVEASGTPVLAQTENTSPTPPAVAAPQPPAATPAPQESATPVPQQAPAPAAGGTVLPETRVVAPAERPRARTPPPRQVVTRQPPAPTPPTQAQVVAQQNQAFDAARQSILTPIANPLGEPSPIKHTTNQTESLTLRNRDFLSSGFRVDSRL